MNLAFGAECYYVSAVTAGVEALGSAGKNYMFAGSFGYEIFQLDRVCVFYSFISTGCLF